MRKPLDAMRIIHWASGADLPSKLPISDPQPDPGLLGPDSLTWRLHEEQWLILSGARAFLMQAAHPIVAQFIAREVLFPQLPLLRRPLWMIVRIITIGQLPPYIRKAYRLRWNIAHRAGFQMARGATHLLRRIFPKTLGKAPLVGFARRRARGELQQTAQSVPSL